MIAPLFSRRSFRALAPVAVALSLSLLSARPARAEGDAGAVDPTCTVAERAESGETCTTCDLTNGDTQCSDELGSDYNFVCQYSSTVQVWCNGPDRTQVLLPACAVRTVPSSSVAGGSVLVALGLAAFAALSRRRARKA